MTSMPPFINYLLCWCDHVIWQKNLEAYHILFADFLHISCWLSVVLCMIFSFEAIPCLTGTLVIWAVFKRSDEVWLSPALPICFTTAYIMPHDVFVFLLNNMHTTCLIYSWFALSFLFQNFVKIPLPAGYLTEWQSWFSYIFHCTLLCIISAWVPINYLIDCLSELPVYGQWNYRAGKFCNEMPWLNFPPLLHISMAFYMLTECLIR